MFKMIYGYIFRRLIKEHLLNIFDVSSRMLIDAGLFILRGVLYRHLVKSYILGASYVFALLIFIFKATSLVITTFNAIVPRPLDHDNAPRYNMTFTCLD